MQASRWRMKLFSGNANPQLAEEIARYLGIPVGDARVSRFSDGEISCAIHESVRGVDVFVVQPTCTPVNENLMELLIMIDAFRRASATRINAVIPYYGYARQDRKSRARDPITAKLVSNLIVQAGAQRVVAVDLHATQIQGFYDIPVDHLPGVPTLAEYFKTKGLEENAVVVSPDVGGVTRARDLATKLRAPLAIVDKRRPAPNVSEIMNVIGEVRGQSVIIVDDIIDTAGTVCTAAEVMLEKGAQDVYACCTHAVFSGPAMDRLSRAPLKEIVITNTISIDESKKLPNMTTLSIAPLVGEAVLRIHEDLEVSKLFEE
ncbi:MAG: ribose-phosphate pyrophosphokinase [Syntrophomonas sp.]|uniref:ribose-phosphate diphosphokinase n=1 Tax=Syntrophomonas sp. TaxID=2053627 RepID=UPI00260F4315|nr:ribose-phosphate pyrophosphokinase [Syntrophomonas sp.]MDD2511019.1 ribose-phosphate pyrophosphokinase [Syntrophomonas sp.]MDD3879827.1 ribose-phosphate pyrophosphokinase [Syntrophomonas sp.]MDD4626342.1 ribose-phosphate pyrophosphokinase [Syntrophomonas sp.]